MSAKATNHVWQFSAAKGSERLMLLAIADEAKDDGHAICEIPVLVYKSQLSKAQTIRVIQTCERKGYFKVVRGGGSGRKNEYVLLGIGLNKEGAEQSQDETVEGSQDATDIRGKRSQKGSHKQSQDETVAYKEEPSKAGKASSVPTERPSDPNTGLIIGAYIEAHQRATGARPGDVGRLSALVPKMLANGWEPDVLTQAARLAGADRFGVAALERIARELQLKPVPNADPLDARKPPGYYDDLPKRNVL